MKSFDEILKEHGVSNYKELPENLRGYMEMAFPDECRYGSKTAEEFKKYEEVQRIEKSNKEYFRKEEEKRQQKRECEIKNACDTAFNVATKMHTDLQEMCIKHRNDLHSCIELNYDVNKKIIKMILKQYINDDYSRNEVDKAIRDAYCEYEIMRNYRY